MGKLVWTLLALGVIAAVAGCDTARFSVKAENNLDRALLVRVSVTVFSNTVSNYAYVVVVPARTQTFIADEGFTSPRVGEIEVLESDCTPLATFTNGIQGGSLIIEDTPRGPSVRLQDGSETGSVDARLTDACPGPLPSMPDPPGVSPSP